VNFTQVSESNLTNGALFFVYSWQSSTGAGKQSDLSSCTVGETVFYPGTSASYVWPLPMVVNFPTINPTVISGSGSNGGIQDTNQPPDSFQLPYFNSGFNSTQRFRWSCPLYNNGSVNNFVPDITITRRVFKDTDGFFKYQITKSGFTNTIKLPNQ
jgi:hypothetical protein